MANGLYGFYKQNLGAKLINMTADDIRATLVVTGGGHYVVNLSTDQFVNVIASGDRTATQQSTLTTLTFALGVFTSANFTWFAVSGSTSQAIVLFDFNGNGATLDSQRMLIAYYDTGITGMPVTPNGGNINVTLNASGWFAL